MGIVAEYHVTSPHLPLVEVAAAVPEATLHVAVGQPNQGGPQPFHLRATDAPIDDVECALTDAAFVADYVDMGRTGAAAQFRVRPATTMEEQLGPIVEDVERLRALAANGSAVERVRVTPEGWHQRRRFADRASFEEYATFWREHGESFTLHRLSRAEVTDAPNSKLTRPQREALVTAAEMGYFDVPRQATLGDVADELDVSGPSLSERLRRAQATLVDEAVEPVAPGDAPSAGTSPTGDRDGRLWGE